MMQLLFPVLFPLVFAPIGRLCAKKRAKCEVLFSVATLSELCAVLYTALFAPDATASLSVCGLGMHFAADRFRALYAVLTAFLWLMTTLFARQYLAHEANPAHRARYYFYGLLTLCGVLGVFYSDDLYTTFVFFELMSFASYPLVIHEETPEAMHAGETYLGVAVIGGMMLLVGIFFLYAQTGTVQFDALRAFFADTKPNALTFAGGVLILLGFGAKAGMFPLHIWLPQAHPVAPAPASALLSGILTKTGVFGIIVLTADIFAQNDHFAVLLLVPAVITMLLGAVLALFSQNLKRTLACSSMSQIGFILTGLSFTGLLGAEGGLAQAGTLLHMANHSLIKLVLFLCAGTVAMNAHALELDRIRGFGRRKPLLMAVFAVGALGIMGVPLFNGYASKTMLHEGITEYINTVAAANGTALIFRAVEGIFLLSGGLTAAYMTKLFVCIFIEKNADAHRQAEMDAMTRYLSPLSAFALIAGLVPMLIIGLFPNAVTQKCIAPAAEFFGTAPLTHSVPFLGFECLKGGLISLLIGAAVYLCIERPLIRRSGYRDRWDPRLDLEAHFYRPILLNGTRFFTVHLLTPLAKLPEFLLTEGTRFFTNTVMRFFAVCFDGVILLLSRTLLRPFVYRYPGMPLSARLGRLWARLSGKKSAEAYAEQLRCFSHSVGTEISDQYNTFSFAFAMISLGIIIVLCFAILR